MQTPKMTQPPEQNFNFEISLSVLNHLGRNLYRNFITVLGEAISNSWDADAKNVWIEINKEDLTFSITDDGIGMDAIDFQEKFLRIGYTKRRHGKIHTPNARPFIGAKGIGKLALLSCADRITIFSKKKGRDYIGGTIDNSDLDEAIKDDLTPDKYLLENPNFNLINEFAEKNESGTIIVFEGTKERIRNSIEHIKKMLALCFRFSILDDNFSIYVNDDKVSIKNLEDLIYRTEFIWLINGYDDDFVAALDKSKIKEIPLITSLSIRGFIATVEKPRHLKITGTDERATIDLFVNGRLREKNILRHIPSQRIVESYLYGQIHFDEMDTHGKDPFTSSREGIIEGDENFEELLKYLKVDALSKIFDDWDRLRLQRGKEGDEENTRKSKKQRKAYALYSLTSGEYSPDPSSTKKDIVDNWLEELREDAAFNITSYVDCFLSENLTRRYINENKIEIEDNIISEAKKWRDRELTKKGKANLSIDIRKANDDIDYLDMDYLAFTIEGSGIPSNEQSLRRDAVSYAPVRNVIAHTSLLTKEAKLHLTSTYENIKARIKTLVSR